MKEVIRKKDVKNNMLSKNTNSSKIGSRSSKSSKAEHYYFFLAEYSLGERPLFIWYIEQKLNVGSGLMHGDDSIYTLFEGIK